jgi:hypothetical protein
MVWDAWAKVWPMLTILCVSVVQAATSVPPLPLPQSGFAIRSRTKTDLGVLEPIVAESRKAFHQTLPTHGSVCRKIVEEECFYTSRVCRLVYHDVMLKNKE